MMLYDVVALNPSMFYLFLEDQLNVCETCRFLRI